MLHLSQQVTTLTFIVLNTIVHHERQLKNIISHSLYLSPVWTRFPLPGVLFPVKQQKTMVFYTLFPGRRFPHDLRQTGRFSLSYKTLIYANGRQNSEGLEIADGDTALVTFAMMAQGKMGADEMARNRTALLEYCKMDTLAMVRLHEVLHGFVSLINQTL